MAFQSLGGKMVIELRLSLKKAKKHTQLQLTTKTERLSQHGHNKRDLNWLTGSQPQYTRETQCGRIQDDARLVQVSQSSLYKSQA